MDAHYTHLLKWTIAGLNAHAAQALFCRSIGVHIGTVDRNHRDLVAGIKLIAQRFAD